MSLNRPIKLTEHGNKIHIKLFNKNIYTAEEKFWQKKSFGDVFCVPLAESCLEEANTPATEREATLMCL